MSPYVIALDQGTTSSRTIIFDSSGKIASVSQQPASVRQSAAAQRNASSRLMAPPAR